MHKPDPRTLMLTIEAAGGDPRRAVMIGDSKTDIDTAKNAGVPVVAVDFGYTDTPVADLRPTGSSRISTNSGRRSTAVLGAINLPPALDGTPLALSYRKAVRVTRRAASSAGEHSLHTGGVTGSIPVPPTIEIRQLYSFILSLNWP